ncbi:hypothetical protein PAI11_02030 [Patulibacter medicamentivorans]|uniref:Uroporphyrinogen decarboxylase (URO-D) domain-containing protein n=1 Tax=Patulibacter medicamentivorans TaxID=1097667 RepID=H0E095_9ACTN|nr:uroporphyrinogen decarboxylase family protein [Patulibacter medicamentivorans]EHN12898.1 hypothetical protein PAI11_02030 [Patulibacter medicamentivorans]
MTLPYTPAGGGPAFVPRTCDFGARLLGIEPAAARTRAADAIVAARQERDLLRPDLLLLGADGTLLPDALGCPLALTASGGWTVDGDAGLSPEEWEEVELGGADALPALGTALETVRALAAEQPTGVLLSGPVTLAAHVAGRRLTLGDDGAEELVDACGLVACDAAKAVLDAGGHVVIEERWAPTDDELELCSPLLNLLAHRGRPALALVHGDEPGALAAGEALGGVAFGPALPAWGDGWHPDATQVAFAPSVAPAASPERVQELVRGIRPGAPAR